MLTIITFIYFNIIFIHKKRFCGAVLRDCSGNHNFHNHNRFSSGTSYCFSFPYTQSFCKLTGTSRVKSFSSYHYVFSIMLVLRSNFSANFMARGYLLLRHLSFIPFELIFESLFFISFV